MSYSKDNRRYQWHKKIFFMGSLVFILTWQSCGGSDPNAWNNQVTNLAVTICSKEIPCYKNNLETIRRKIPKIISMQIKRALPARKIEKQACIASYKAYFNYHKIVPWNKIKPYFLQCKNEIVKLTCPSILKQKKLPMACQQLTQQVVKLSK